MGTRERILAEAEALFLERGFKSAPLRTIVGNAGFTLGAFYGYFATKEDLFYALTDEAAAGITRILGEIRAEMEQLPERERLVRMSSCYLARLPELVDFVDARKNATRLLLTRAEGTKYEGFLSEIEARSYSTDQAIARANTPAASAGLHPATIRLLMHAYYSMLGEALISDAPRDEILMVMEQAQMVFETGLMAGLGLQKQDS